MKKYFTFNFLVGLLILSFLSTTLLAQNTFYKKYGHEGIEWGQFVIETNGGGYAIVGSTNSMGAGNYDVWLLVTDSNGDTLWTKTYGGPNDDQGYCVRQTADNGFIVAAHKTVEGNYKDGWVFKTDAVGNIEWERFFGTDLNGESVTSIVPSTDNTFIACGNMASKSYVFKIDDLGQVIWENSYFPNQSSSTSSICKANDNLYAVVGSFQSQSAGDWFPNIFTIDNDGNLGYQLTYMNPGYFTFVIATSNDNFIFGGIENGQNVVYNNLLDGMEQWVYYYDSQYNSSARAATETANGNVVVTDNSWYASLRELDINNADVLWARTSDFGIDYPKYVNLSSTNDNGIIITGYTSNHELVLVKTLQNGGMSGIDANNFTDNSISMSENYPNPFIANTNFSVSVAASKMVKLYVVDIHGNVVTNLLNKKLAPGDYSFSWNGNNSNGSACAPGTYYLVLKTNNGVVASRKMIKIGNAN